MFHLFHIIRTLAKYDALFFAKNIRSIRFVCFLVGGASRKYKNLSKGERLARAFEELGPGFIKLGQALSVRVDIVGNDVAKDLTKLQDKLPSFSTKKAKEIIEEELKKPVDKIFKNFEDKPVAAASIAQVHFATDYDGNKLAVKVLRPEVRRKFKKDISLLYWLLKIASRTGKIKKNVKSLKLKEVIDDIKNVVRKEMDFRLEAAAASQLKENLKGEADIVKIPEVDWDKTSERVLTTERVCGININKKSDLEKAGHDVDEILTKLSNLFFMQSYRDGYFHADMHPGNILVDEKGRIVLIDFGIMGYLDEDNRVYLAKMWISFFNRDYYRMADLHFRAGFISQKHDRMEVAQAFRSVYEKIQGKAQKDISAKNLISQMLKVIDQFDIQLPPQVLLLEKNMILAEGVSRKLNLDINFWELSKPLMKDWAKDHLSKKVVISNFKKDLGNVVDTIRNLHKISNNINEIITEKGIKVEGNKENNDLKKLLFISFVSSVTTLITMFFILKIYNFI